MKTIIGFLLCLALITTINNLYGQGEVVQDNYDSLPVFTIVEQMPEYPGGEFALKQFFINNINYPVSNYDQDIQGKVYVSFIVEPNGRTSNVTIARGITEVHDREAIRLVSATLWKPGRQSGKAVRVRMVIPVDFTRSPDYTTPRRVDHGDSVYYQGRYMTKEEKERLLKETEKKEFESYFMPGLAYSYYKPKGSDSVGSFQGLVVEYLLLAVVHPNDKPGPSHIRLYAKLNMMQSSKENIKNMFAYSLGLDLSLEKNPKRTWFVPYFGLEFGGLSAKQLGTRVQFTPIIGAHIISRKNLFINVHGGYVYPITDFDIFQGWFGQAGLNFALW